MTNLHQQAQWQDVPFQKRINLRSGKRPVAYGNEISPRSAPLEFRQLTLNLVPQTAIIRPNNLLQKPELPLPYLPPIEKWSLKIGRCLIEVLLMQRPLPQLARWVTPVIYAQLRERLQKDRLQGICSLSLKLKGNSARGLAIKAKKPIPVQGHRLGVGKTYCQEIPREFGQPKAVEVAMSIAIDERYRALAMRYEERNRRWLLCALEIA